MLVNGARPDAEIPRDFLGLFVGRDARQAGPLPGREGVNADSRHGLSLSVIRLWRKRRGGLRLPACTTEMPVAFCPSASCRSQGLEKVIARAMVNGA